MKMDIFARRRSALVGAGLSLLTLGAASADTMECSNTITKSRAERSLFGIFRDAPTVASTDPDILPLSDGRKLQQVGQAFTIYINDRVAYLVTARHVVRSLCSMTTGGLVAVASIGGEYRSAPIQILEEKADICADIENLRGPDASIVKIDLGAAGIDRSSIVPLPVAASHPILGNHSRMAAPRFKANILVLSVDQTLTPIAISASTGAVSLRQTDINRDFKSESLYTLIAATPPGTSGAPVVAEIDGRVFVVGLVTHSFMHVRKWTVDRNADEVMRGLSANVVQLIAAEVLRNNILEASKGIIQNLSFLNQREIELTERDKVDVENVWQRITDLKFGQNDNAERAFQIAYEASRLSSIGQLEIIRRFIGLQKSNPKHPAILLSAAALSERDWCWNWSIFDAYKTQLATGGIANRWLTLDERLTVAEQGVQLLALANRLPGHRQAEITKDAALLMSVARQTTANRMSPPPDVRWYATAEAFSVPQTSSPAPFNRPSGFVSQQLTESDRVLAGMMRWEKEKTIDLSWLDNSPLSSQTKSRINNIVANEALANLRILSLESKGIRNPSDHAYQLAVQAIARNQNNNALKESLYKSLSGPVAPQLKNGAAIATTGNANRALQAAMGVPWDIPADALKEMNAYQPPIGRPGQEGRF